MKKFYILFILFYISSCGSIPKEYQLVNGSIPESDNYSCIELFNKIQNAWAKHENTSMEEGCYHYNKRLIDDILENKECLIGIKESELINLFGPPSHKGLHNYHYFMSIRCDSINSTGEHHLRFTVKDTVGTIEYYPITSVY